MVNVTLLIMELWKMMRLVCPTEIYLCHAKRERTEKLEDEILRFLGGGIRRKMCIRYATQFDLF